MEPDRPFGGPWLDEVGAVGPKRVLISLDHGLSVVYFLQSDVVTTLLEAGVEVVVLTDETLIPEIRTRFGRRGLAVEGLRLQEAKGYQVMVARERQWWLQFLRRVGGSREINTKAMDSYIRQVMVEEPPWRMVLMPVAWLGIWYLRRSAAARGLLVRLQKRWVPGLYGDLLRRTRPDLVVASSPGWRLDRYLLREAGQQGIETGAVIMGWDNPSSYGVPGAEVRWVNCWSDIQRRELERGADWRDGQVHVGGIPSYDGYFRGRWVMDREDYFKLHGLDPFRKLISYACSFVSFSPNLQNVRALAELVASDCLSEPCQLLVRLHPNHFMDHPLYKGEADRIRDLRKEMRHVRIVEPKALGGFYGHYSGEDMPEKASMLAHSDVFATVYSTMVVEAAIHRKPILSVCIDAPGGWRKFRKFSLPLSRIGGWPTHQRFRESGAGRVVTSPGELRDALEFYLGHPKADEEKQRAFVERECTYTDGSAGARTGKFLLSRLRGRP
jgi:CDP-Glycerol:Poly(glycerophosphate) glycerophosphotransferase